jgi:RNA polymerase sigma factor (sigma-70 family)
MTSPSTVTRTATTAKATRADGMDRADLASLVGRATSGDQVAITAIIERFRPLVRAVVTRAGVFGSDADDVIQETWLRLVCSIDKVREPNALPRWLVVTAGRLCLNLFRSRSRIALCADAPELGPVVADPCAEEAIRADATTRLGEALDGLGARDRALMDLLLDARPYKEISEQMNMPVGSIGPTRERVFRKLAASSPLRALTTDLVPAA